MHRKMSVVRTDYSYYLRSDINFVIPMVLIFLVSVSALGTSGDKVEVKGMITTRTGETLVVKSARGNVTVVLTGDTTTKDDRGLFGLEKEHMSDVVLIPGLKIDVDGTSDSRSRVVAKTITVDGDDLETAEMIYRTASRGQHTGH